jgi:serine phosphatase RsbU (regulator of sigma subunit)
MDIALCSLSVDSNQSSVIQYAGAHNPLWIIRPVRHSELDSESPNKKIADQARNDEFELIETKANKQPIGQFDNPEPYITHTIELQKGDSLYIFSDGYADQFGGEKGKKLKTANFKKLLLSIQNETMEKQKQLIDDAFENWKGSLEQLDDVCVIGVRIG